MEYRISVTRQQANAIERILADTNVTLSLTFNQEATELYSVTGIGIETWDVLITPGGNEKFSQEGDHTTAFLTAVFLAGQAYQANKPQADAQQRTINAAELREIRKRLEMTQAEFADYLGVARRTVQDWELGNRKIPSTVVELLRMKGQIQ